MTFPVKLAGVVFVLWLLNLACVQWVGFSPAYCWLWSGVWGVLQPLASVTLLVLSLYFFWAMVSAGLLSGKALAAAFLMLLVGGADGWMKAILTLPGKVCG